MDMTLFDVLPSLMLDGLWIGLGVFLVVQAFKYARLFAWPWLDPARLALIAGLFFGLLWGAVEIEAQSGIWSVAVIVGIVFRWIVGSLTAALFYGIVLKPLLEKLSVDEKYYRWQKDPKDTLLLPEEIGPVG